MEIFRFWYGWVEFDFVLAIPWVLAIFNHFQPFPEIYRNIKLFSANSSYNVMIFLSCTKNFENTFVLQI